MISKRADGEKKEKKVDEGLIDAAQVARDRRAEGFTRTPSQALSIISERSCVRSMSCCRSGEAVRFHSSHLSSSQLAGLDLKQQKPAVVKKSRE